MEKSTKEILEAKQEGNYSKVQKLQQTLSKPFKKINAMNKEYNKQELPQAKTMEDTVAYIKENYPETEQDLQKVLNKMYLTFCKKQFDYGPGNIAMGTSLKTEEEINMALLGIIVRLNDKINRLVNLSTKHNFEAKNEPIEDAFLDTAIYAAMALIVKNQKWGK
jgi:DNA-directed RNA polymerase subunit F